MQLEDVIVIGACSMLSIKTGLGGVYEPSIPEIHMALKTANKVWREYWRLKRAEELPDEV